MCRKCRGRIFFRNESSQNLEGGFLRTRTESGEKFPMSTAMCLESTGGGASDDAKSDEHVGKSTSKSCMAFEEDWKV